MPKVTNRWPKFAKSCQSSQRLKVAKSCQKYQKLAKGSTSWPKLPNVLNDFENVRRYCLALNSSNSSSGYYKITNRSGVRVKRAANLTLLMGKGWTCRHHGKSTRFSFLPPGCDNFSSGLQSKEMNF